MPFSSIRIRRRTDSPAVESVALIIADRISGRCPAGVSTENEGDLTLDLDIRPGIGAEGFRVADGPGRAVEIVGNDERGLLYGAGKFLRSSVYGPEGFTPSAWRGASAPDCPVRGVYFATHFNNFYEAAPIDEVKTYLEDVALWGINAVTLHFPTHQFDGFDDPGAVANLAQLRALADAANSLGLGVGLVICPNCGFKSAPKEYLFTRFGDELHARGYLGTLLCPSKPEAREYLLAIWDRLLGEFSQTGLDHIWCWPYDEGGCGCDGCSPWGGRGYLDISKRVSGLYRRRYPDGRFILSTWQFDLPPTGEWEGLARELAEDTGWVDFIMADSNDAPFPAYPLRNGVPGGLPLVGFPEISMWRIGPWGGFGASPFPEYLEAHWRESSEHLSGGFPYSEGIYEDINKVLFAAFYWDKDRSGEDILREYATFEFSPEIADDVLAAIRIFEQNHYHMRLPDGFRCEVGENAVRAFELLDDADRRLPERARKSWRWRILYLRALIDKELYLNGGKLEGTKFKQAFDELTLIYHAQNAWEDRLRPPRLA